MRNGAISMGFILQQQHRMIGGVDLHRRKRCRGSDASAIARRTASVPVCLQLGGGDTQLQEPWTGGSDLVRQEAWDRRGGEELSIYTHG